jgi:hypothetical protein
MIILDESIITPEKKNMEPGLFRLGMILAKIIFGEDYKDGKMK